MLQSSHKRAAQHVTQGRHSLEGGGWGVATKPMSSHGFSVMLTAVISPLQALEGANAEARIEVSFNAHPVDIMQTSMHLMLCTGHQNLVWLEHVPALLL